LLPPRLSGDRPPARGAHSGQAAIAWWDSLERGLPRLAEEFRSCRQGVCRRVRDARPGWAEAVASGLPFLRLGRIEAGHYDPVFAVPPRDKKVLQVDTLVVGNGCASRSATQGLITVLADLDPLFLKHNRDTPNLTGLPWATVARAYFDAGAPDVVGVYAPWVLDVLPTATWIQLALGISVLFNAMGAFNRFRLTRLDAQRVAIEREISRLFGSGITVGELARAQPVADLDPEEVQQRLRGATQALEALYGRCRKQSLSIFVPMGGEMAYRYQENLTMDLLRALRSYA